MYKFINWYLQHGSFPHRGWKYFRAFLQRTGLYERRFTRKLPNGARFHVHPNDHIQQQILWYGYYEREAVLCWEALSRADSVVLDIGANTGYYSVMAAVKGAQVYAFEPVMALQQELQDNIRLNPEMRITPVATALGAGTGKADMFISGPDNRGMSGFHQPDNHTGEVEAVPLTTLDVWVTQNGIDAPSLIKIDTEGAEPDILRGMKGTLEKARPVIFMEVMAAQLQQSGHTAEDIFTFMGTLGYEAFLPLPGLLVKRLKAAVCADVIIFHPAGKAWPAGFRIQD